MILKIKVGGGIALWLPVDRDVYKEKCSCYLKKKNIYGYN